MERTVQFYWSSKARNPKLHASLGCSGIFRQKVNLGTRVELRSASTADLGEDIPEVLDVPVTYRYYDASCDTFESSGPLTLEKIANHDYRPCRLCALELVFDLAMRSGTPSEPVTFSGQFLPDEVGLHKFEFEELSTSSRERIIRILSREDSLERTDTSCGPIGYGLVTPLAKRILFSSLRTYEVPKSFQHLVCDEARSSSFARGAFDLYWALRNRRPPETNQDSHEAELAETAINLAK